MHCLGLEGLSRQSREEPGLQSGMRALHIWRQEQVKSEVQKTEEQLQGYVRAPRANLICIIVQRRARLIYCCFRSGLFAKSEINMHSLSEFLQSFEKLLLTEYLKENQLFIHKV